MTPADIAALRGRIEELGRERDEARADARLGNEIAAKVNNAINRAGIHCALYFWEAIDQIAKERDEARAEVKRYRSQLEENADLRDSLIHACELQRASHDNARQLSAMRYVANDRSAPFSHARVRERYEEYVKEE